MPRTRPSPPVPEDSGSTKRPRAASAAATTTAKRTRKEPRPPPADSSGVDWRAAFDSGDVGKRSVEELKKFLRSRGGRLGGRKADLVERVREILGGEDG